MLKYTLWNNRNYKILDFEAASELEARQALEELGTAIIEAIGHHAIAFRIDDRSEGILSLSIPLQLGKTLKITMTPKQNVSGS